MKRELAAVAGAAVVAGLVQGAPTAGAVSCPDEADPIVVTARATDTVLYRTGGTTRITVTAHDDRDDLDPCGSGVKAVTASFYSENGDVRRGTATLSRVSGDKFDGTWQGSFHFTQHAFTGRWRLDMRAVDNWGNARSYPGLDVFVLRRNTTLKLDADPEPVPEGTKFALRGRAKKLTRYDGYVGYGNRRVYFMFRPEGTNDLLDKGTTTTRADGSFSVNRTAYRAGTWIAIIPPTATYARAAAREFLDTA